MCDIQHVLNYFLLIIVNTYCNTETGMFMKCSPMLTTRLLDAIIILIVVQYLFVSPPLLLCLAPRCRSRSLGELRRARIRVEMAKLCQSQSLTGLSSLLLHVSASCSNFIMYLLLLALAPLERYIRMRHYYQIITPLVFKKIKFLKTNLSLTFYH